MNSRFLLEFFWVIMDGMIPTCLRVVPVNRLVLDIHLHPYSCGSFLKWVHPNSWMVKQWKLNNIDDLGVLGNPHLCLLVKTFPFVTVGWIVVNIAVVVMTFSMRM